MALSDSEFKSLPLCIQVTCMVGWKKCWCKLQSSELLNERWGRSLRCWIFLQSQLTIFFFLVAGSNAGTADEEFRTISPGIGGHWGWGQTFCLCKWEAFGGKSTWPVGEIHVPLDSMMTASSISGDSNRYEDCRLRRRESTSSPPELSESKARFATATTVSRSRGPTTLPACELGSRFNGSNSLSIECSSCSCRRFSHMTKMNFSTCSFVHCFRPSGRPRETAMAPTGKPVKDSKDVLLLETSAFVISHFPSPEIAQ
mmetsp:Transcript_21392/g.31243  ORF Transcript_21392/g.31243 Transcript_21392/m.31243 type:complete len:257 (+) Transcript_21392:616-1386(+)